MRARDIMTKDPSFVTPYDTVTQAARLMAQRDVGMLPVVDSPDKRHVLGVITDRDIAIRHVALAHGPECRVHQHMTEQVVRTAYEEDDIHEVMDLMRQARVRRLPVVDIGNRLVGVIAQADLALRVGRDEPVTFERLVESLSEPAVPAH